MSITLSVRPVATEIAPQAEHFDVLVALAAPQTVPATNRPTVNLAIVIDRSGSMDGKPLREAKRAAKAIVERLSARDRVCIVDYDDQVRVVLESMDGETAKRVAPARIEEIVTGGMTNLHGGWLVGCQQLAPHVRDYAINRVIVLSDGQANVGITDIGTIRDQAAALAPTGVTTTTMGLGQNFNEDLMTALAQAGQGNAHYAESADELMDAFSGEFTMLAATVARSVSLRILEASASHVCLNGHRETAGALALPNLLAAAETWAVLRFARPAEGWDGLSLAVEASFEPVSAEGVGARVTLPSLTTRIATGCAGIVDTLVSGRVAELEAAIEQERVRELIDHGDFGAAKASLDAMSVRFADNDWIAGSVANMRELAERGDLLALRKEATYSTMSARTRVAELSELSDASLSADTVYNLRKTTQGRHRRRADPN